MIRLACRCWFAAAALAAMVLPLRALELETPQPASAGTMSGAARATADAAGEAWEAWIAVTVPNIQPLIRVKRNPQVLAQFEKQIGEPVGRMYRAELSFFRNVCRPTDRQFAEIEKASEAANRAAVKQFAELVYDLNVEGAIPVPGAQLGVFAGRYDPDPRTFLTSKFASLARSRLSSEQAARYERQLKLRTAAVDRAARGLLIANLDLRLYFTTDQRRKAEEILARSWNSQWTRLALGGSASSEQNGTCPAEAGKLIVPLLTNTQKLIWKGLEMSDQIPPGAVLDIELLGLLGENIGDAGGFNAGLAVPDRDEPADGPPLDAKPAKPEDKK